MPYWVIFVGGGLCVILSSCAGCPWKQETITEVTSDQVSLSIPKPPPVRPPPPPPPEPEVEPEVESEPVVPPEEILAGLTASGAPPVPPGTFKADDLTMRLREKMAEAYGGNLSRVPEANIYLSNGTLQEFIDFYEERGYNVSRITVPVKRILQPVVRDKPELADRIRLDEYEGMSIHQAMVDGTGVSAADKYIDPDTYEVVDRLFVTEMPLK